VSSLAQEGALTVGEAREVGEDRAGGGLGLAGSLVLHATVLLAFFVAGQNGWQASAGGGRFIPVEVVTEATNAARPSASGAAILPGPWRPGAQADAASSGGAQAAAQDAGKTKPDALEGQLEALAALSRSNAEIQSGPNREMAATGDTEAFGSRTPYGLRDFLRAQVERRWHLDLAALAGADVSVPIHVEIARDGSVLKAEIARGGKSDDPVYREIASSARNAVLAASPFALPPGRYGETMEVVLDLNPRDTLR
jgi:hypothetical protein